MQRGAPVVEIHTGAYADAATDEARIAEFERIRKAVAYGRSIGLTVNAGHGLTYHNVQPIAALPGIHELNIGHAIVAQALVRGLERGGGGNEAADGGGCAGCLRFGGQRSSTNRNHLRVPAARES